MRNIFRQLFRSSAAGIVAGAVVVVAVVGATSAQFGAGPLAGPDTTEAGAPDDTTVESIPTVDSGSNERLDGIDARLDGLDTQVEALSQDNVTLRRGLEEQEKALTSVTRTVTTHADDISQLQTSLKGAKAALEKLSDSLLALQDSVAVLEKKAAKLTEEGNYTGPVDPAQFTRRLTPSDISGNWPLARTTDTLDIKKLGTPTFGCYSDSRYNTFVTVDSWGAYTCTKILK